MRISIIGKFAKLYDEEYIARSFEMIGHEVKRISDKNTIKDIYEISKLFNSEMVLFSKLNQGPITFDYINKWKADGIKTVSWLFDLYIGYQRENHINRMPFFKADYLFTTDGGHENEWKEYGINHKLLRQGIYKPDCFIVPPVNPEGICFVGSYNPYNEDRNIKIDKVAKRYKNFKWFGKENTHQVRDRDLNDLYSKYKVVVGDSVYSPNYWSNRVVETLGRGGFLIHQEVEGIKEEYPYLVTYKKDDIEDLFTKIDYYLEHEDERLDIINKNHKWVLDNYTCDKKCEQLIKML